MKTILSTADGAIELRFAFTVSPAVKKTHSDSHWWLNGQYYFGEQ